MPSSILLWTMTSTNGPEYLGYPFLGLFCPRTATESESARCVYRVMHGMCMATIEDIINRVAGTAVGETAIISHPLPTPSARFLIGMERECQQNDSLAAGLG